MTPAGGRARRRAQVPRRAAAGAGAAARGRLLALLEEGEDVLLGDAAGAAGALDLGEVHAVLRRDLADERRGAPAQPLLRRLGPPVARGGAARRGRGRRRARRAASRRRLRRLGLPAPAPPPRAAAAAGAAPFSVSM